MSATLKARRSRTLNALHSKLVGYMARAGLIAFIDAPAGGDTHLGGEPAPAAPIAAPVAATPAAPAAPVAATPAAPAVAAPAVDPNDPASVQAAADAAAAAAKEAEKAKTGAPEKYEDFKLPEGMTADAPAVGKFAEWAKANNLTQEAAQQAMDMAAQMQTGNAEQLQTAIETQAKKWGDESLVDKEFGGEKFQENLAVAKKALDQFGTPELKTLLKDSKMGNHPEVLRFFFRAGQAISQDGFVPGRTGATRVDTANVLYGNTTH